MTIRHPFTACAVAAALVLCGAAAGALAAPDCKNAMNTLEINECASIEQKAVEARLNQVYQRVLKTLDGEGRDSAATRAKLVAAQRAWVRFREADCDAVYERHAGGTIRTVMYIGCMQSHAEQRIKALEAFAETY